MKYLYKCTLVSGGIVSFICNAIYNVYYGTLHQKRSGFGHCGGGGHRCGFGHCGGGGRCGGGGGGGGEKEEGRQVKEEEELVKDGENERI